MAVARSEVMGSAVEEKKKAAVGTGPHPHSAAEEGQGGCRAWPGGTASSKEVSWESETFILFGFLSLG